MTTVIRLHIDPEEAIYYSREMKNRGYKQGVDFDFAYHKATYTTDMWEEKTPKTAVFTFYNEQLATWFTLWR